ncbi:cell division protein FtsQ/DivIB [Cellulosilyticum lentocellum]|uniref:Polypeptide-transport-associated domain protein FtsQ-type n=1 Tax=Cellulosilyticum lentocellum (strain ATCC 49066 / DSM 5427 / NCIMB 11756 / RHM5) TaxID=642492 RepID=F2JS99_CELLD|nr:FtsQ-type POTRA domain-containing protein [Cellulosilyticum lentocellum]ADZ84036.1 Polypeptide-transport-associated domain protein FtsQ-type [Cellulosilyticum lentocellum DSM 5427]
MKKEQQKKKRKLYIGIIIGLILLLFFMMPIFYINEIQVKNNHFYTAEDIIQTAGVQKKHFFDLSFNEAKKQLLELPYIKEVKLNYIFPGKLEIDVVEKSPFAYVEFSGNYICLNENAQVIEQSPKMYHELPIIQGLKFESFKIGEVLPIQNNEEWLCATEVIRYLEKHQYIKEVSKIDVYNLEEIHLYVDKLNVIMGDISDFDKKIEVLIKVHAEYNMGILDLSTFAKRGEAFLNPIT